MLFDERKTIKTLPYEEAVNYILVQWLNGHIDESDVCSLIRTLILRYGRSRTFKAT
jgi:hypothetical protein